MSVQELSLRFFYVSFFSYPSSSFFIFRMFLYVNQVRQLLRDDPKNSEFLDMEKELVEVINF